MPSKSYAELGKERILVAMHSKKRINGSEPTVRALGSLVSVTLSRSDWRTLRQESETLAWDSSVTGIERRLATKAAAILGSELAMQAGEQITISTALGNWRTLSRLFATYQSKVDRRCLNAVSRLAAQVENTRVENTQGGAGCAK